MKTITLTITIDAETGEAEPMTNAGNLAGHELDRALSLLASACLQLSQTYQERRIVLARQQAVARRDEEE